MTRAGHIHVAGAIALLLHALAPVMILVIFGLRVAELVPFWLLAISTLPIMFCGEAGRFPGAPRHVWSRTQNRRS
jgi:hypothetical protein